MRLSNSATIRNCEASLSSSHGVAVAPLSAPPRIKHASLAGRDGADDSKLAEHTWTASRKESRIARTVVLHEVCSSTLEAYVVSL
jgi:hypothetical protein